MRTEVLILHNIRSLYNVGAILRTAEGFGVQKIICSGYTPTPQTSSSTHLPYIAKRINKQITKTALGAEKLLSIESEPELVTVVEELRTKKYHVCALEQAPSATSIKQFHSNRPIAIIAGPEVSGLNPNELALCDDILEIPMQGQKESFNVSVAVGIALYALNYPQAKH